MLSMSRFARRSGARLTKGRFAQQLRGKVDIAAPAQKAKSFKADLEDANADTDYDVVTHRLRMTLEVAVSKIFPAGFCWQYSSVVAENHGYTTNDMGFFIYTGCGDFLGIAVGHSLFYCGLARLWNKDINNLHEIQTGVFIGSAGFFTGAVWQPLVNYAHDVGMTFTEAAAFVGIFGGMTFYGGIRFFRQLYGSQMGWKGIDKSVGYVPDGQLSLAIGFADAGFVGTDIGFQNNFLSPICGINPEDSVLTGMNKAGTSTFIGYTTGQMIENTCVRKGHLWLDKAPAKIVDERKQ